MEETVTGASKGEQMGHVVPPPTSDSRKSARSEKVEALVQRAKEAKIEEAMEEADQIIEEMLDSPLQPRCIETSKTHLIEALKRHGLKLKPQWDETVDEDGKTVRKSAGLVDIIIPER